jgi:Ca-activated chloride channel family protein
MNPLVVSLLLAGLGSSAPLARRPAMNVCLAIDRSQARPGTEIAAAREGAFAALRRLGPADIVSVVAYDDVVQVLVPATRFPERGLIENGLRAQPAGGTALFAGVVKCAGELRKFADGNRVNRIIVLSEGTVGAGLGGLRAQLVEEGISVATVGLGPSRNADLLSALDAGEAGHTTVERTDQPDAARATKERRLQARARRVREQPREVDRRPVLRNIHDLSQSIGNGPLDGVLMDGTQL